MLDYVEVGKRIRRARTEKRITQEKFAEMIGVSTGYISQIESGLKCFNLKRFNEVGRILDKPTSYFIEGTDEHNSDFLITEIVELLKGASEEKIKVIKDVVKTILDKE
ncbi:MAG: helix-turn-helix transcriptional regulator [Clostridia bacterium]|nr:helix-turn-helix transcriptional regulator [Clostridia bacterium]